MTARNPIINRATPVADESVHARMLARYLANRLHPCIAVILAYEDATGTGQGGGAARLSHHRTEGPTHEWTAA